MSQFGELPDWFGQKLFKNAKITTKRMKIGQKLLKNAKKPEMADFGRYQNGFYKIAKSSLF